MKIVRLFAAAAIIAVLAGPQAEAHGRAGSPVVLSGRLTTAAGSAATGVVGVLAWPEPLPMKVGSAFAMIPVATQRTVSDGTFTFTAADLANPAASAALARAAHWNGGWVNVEVVGRTAAARAFRRHPFM